jgi:TolB-like protein/Flp pilus assembly protein TadD
MGIVYRATDTKLNRPAAIKVLPENLADPEARRRFQREAQMASSLNHPHIVTVYDAGEYLERQYLITEYVDGGTLRQWAARPHGWLAIAELLIGVADAVAVAHEAGILHRDIKPENILLAKNGYAKLADFGLAKLFEVDPLADDPFGALPQGGHSTLMGTAAYMSPEQAAGLALDARSDVYSFGLVLHELLSGQRPSGSRPLGQRQRSDVEPLAPLPDDVPAELRTLVAKALEHEPADRYQSMRDLVVDLRRVVRRSGLETSPATADSVEPALARTGTTGPQRASQRSLWYAAAALALLAVFGFATREMLFDGHPATSVAVLPFVNESGDAADLHISEGLGDELRAALMALPSLSVQARASSISFRDQNADIPTIATALEVGRLINGSVRRQGRTLEVVIEVLDDRGFAIQPPLRYARPESDLQAMQREIAAQVGSLLAPDVDRNAGAAPAPPTSQSESANMLVLSGSRAFLQVKDEFLVDEAKLDLAIDYFKRATVADPKSVAAHSRLAGALLYKGDTDAASAPLQRALELGGAIEPTSAAADLSDAWLSTALYLLRTRNATGVGAAYQRAVELNPNNADALGAFAQWLMVHARTAEADAYFREAIRHDRRSLPRYLDYAEYLGIIEEMDAVREVGREIESRFPDVRGHLALARLHEITGDIDVGIAWALKAYRVQPNDDATRGQIGELHARIGLFDIAAQYDPGPRMYQLYYQRRYEELIDVAQEFVIENRNDPSAMYMLAFAYNAAGYFEFARRTLEDAGMPVQPGADYISGGAEYQALTSYVDALLNLNADDPLARKLAEERLGVDAIIEERNMGRSWWSNSYRACALGHVGRYSDALNLLDRVRNAQGLAWSPVLQDSPCFKPLANEPRYLALLEHLEQRQKMLRERLPDTLREHGVADVRPVSAP